MTPSKARRVTQIQQEMLLQFMQENPQFAARRATTPLDRALYDQKWEELAITLNGGGEGSQKSVAEWRKTWSDWRKNVRFKASGAKDADGKPGEGARKLACVERRLLELVGAGPPLKSPHCNVNSVGPAMVGARAAQPAGSYALPQTVFPAQVSKSDSNFESSSSTWLNPTTADVEVLDTIESDHDSDIDTTHASLSNSKGCQKEPPTSPQQSQFPVRQSAPEAKRVRVGGGVGGGDVWGAGADKGASSLEERKLALEERRLDLDERRFKLEQRRLLHEQARASMDRESHDIDMKMKRTLLYHMYRQH